MTLDDYNAFCRSLPHTSHVVQWGGAHVWKVDGKVFAIGHDDEAEMETVTFKCSDLSYELLSGMPGCRPAPYLASRGMKWIQRTSTETLDDTALRAYLAESHRIVSLGLSRRRQQELGIGQFAKLAKPAGRSKSSHSRSSKPRTSRANGGTHP